MKYNSLVTILFIASIFGQDKKIFDPNQLKDPEPKWPTILNPIFEDSTLTKQGSHSDSVQTILEGYRVQVLATRTLENAEEIKADLREKWTEEVYITFEAPNYKVRIGNFIDRRDAEAVRDRLAIEGFPSAWIIRTRIELIE